MAIVRLNVLNDISNKKLVVNSTSGEDFILPAFYPEDKISWTVQLLEVNPSGGQRAPYSVIDATGKELTIKIGNLADGVIVASALPGAFAVINQAFSGYLELNTVNMVAAMSGQTSITRTIEFQIGDVDSVTMTTLQKTVTIKKELITSGSPTAIPNVRYYTSDEIDAMFVRFDNSSVASRGRTVTLYSPDGTALRQIGVNNDKSALDNLA